MSFLLRTSRAMAVTGRSPSSMIVARYFSVSASRALKESDSQDHASADYEKHKQDSLRKSKDGKGHWKPELASNSEEAVAADRGAHDHSEEGIEELQRKTKDHAEEKHKHGTSQEPGL